VTLNGKAPADITLDTSSSNTNAAQVGGKANVKAGNDSTTFLIHAENVKEVMESNINASYKGTGLPLADQLVVKVAPVELTDLTIKPVEMVGGKSAIATVTLSAGLPAAGTVILTVPAGSPVKMPIPDVSIKATKSTGITVITTTPVKADTKVTVTATYGGFTKTATITVLAPQLEDVTAPATVKGNGTTTAKVTITLTGPAPAGGIKVNLESPSPFPIPKGTTVTVPAGSTTAESKPITAAKVVKNTAVNIEASYNGVTKTASITVTKP
jgi:hypothetical protein